MTDREVRIFEETAIRIMAELSLNLDMSWDECAKQACLGADAFIAELARRAKEEAK